MHDTLAALATYGLVDGPALVAPPAAAWDELLVEAERHRLIGLLAAAIDDGAITVEDRIGTEVAARFEAHMVACMALERTLFEVDEVLVEADISLRVLKGPALAHTLARRPGQRTFGDIDVLIRSDHIDRAVAALVAAGGRRRLPEMAAGFDRRFAKSVTMQWGNHEIDLHRTLAAGLFGVWIDEESLWSEPVPFVVADRTFPTLDRERHLVHACYHAELGDIEATLASRRDIAMLAAHPELDERQVRGLAHAWRGEAVLARALTNTADLLPHRHGPLYDWALSYPVPVEQQRALDAYRTEHRRFARQGVAMIRALPNRRDRVAFARAVVWPSRAHLRARGLSRWRHLVRR